MFKRVRQHGNVWKHGANLVHASDMIGVRVRKKNGLWFQTLVAQEMQHWLRRLAWINHPTCGRALLNMRYSLILGLILRLIVPLLRGHFNHIGVGLATTQFKCMKCDCASHAQPYTARREMQQDIVAWN